MVRETELFESTDLTPLDLCFSHWKKNEAHKTEVDTTDELIERSFDAAACIKKEEQQAIFAYELQSALRLHLHVSTQKRSS